MLTFCSQHQEKASLESCIHIHIIFNKSILSSDLENGNHSSVIYRAFGITHICH